MKSPAGPLLTVRSVPYSSSVVQELIAGMDADLSARYGSPSLDPVDGAALVPPRGEMLVAYADDVPVGCGGFERVDEGLCELRRLFVVRPWRGRGVGRFLLRELEERAWASGYGAMRLETGTRQHEALALYRACGYREIPRFPPHVGDDWSVCMAKELRAPYES